MGTNVTLASNVKHRGSKVFSDDGHLNASSNKDAMQILASVIEQISKGATILTDNEAQTAALTEAARQERKAVMAAIIQDPKGSTHKKTAMSLAGTISETAARIGIMRRICQEGMVEQGQRPEITIEHRDVTAVVMTGPTTARLQVVRSPYIQPPEVSLTARIYVETREINQTRDDILQRKYNEAVDSIIVQEDRMWKAGSDALIDANGQGSTHVGTGITRGMMESGMASVTDWGLPLANILFSSNLFTNLHVNQDFENLIDPVTRLELVRTGFVGTLFGAAVITDGVREPTQRVLGKGEIYFTSLPQYIGEYTDRGGVDAQPIGSAETGVNGAGFHLNEEMSLGLVNHRAISRTRLV